MHATEKHPSMMPGLQRAVYSRRDRVLRRRAWHGAAYLALLVAAACSDPAQPSAVQAPDQLFWSLRLNHHAINVSTTAPYDTVTLVATPYNVNGEALPNAPTATFKSADASVLAFPTGMIKGVTQQSSATGTLVIATLTYHGVTRADTAYVTVTNVASPPQLTDFSIQLAAGDSNRIASQGYFDTRTKTLPLFARASGATIPRFNVFFESSNRTVATVNRSTGVVTALLPGTVTIRASAMTYGVPSTDSVEFVVTDPLAVAITYKTVGEQHYDTFVSPGADVFWSNPTPDSVDLVFDDPSAAARGGTTFFGVFLADSAGNIGPFAAVDSTTPGNRVRSFPQRGTFHYHSTRYPITGTITVR
jgi:hypothetical protein